jgi:hypothetical protein
MTATAWHRQISWASFSRRSVKRGGRRISNLMPMGSARGLAALRLALRLPAFRHSAQRLRRGRGVRHGRRCSARRWPLGRDSLGPRLAGKCPGHIVTRCAVRSLPDDHLLPGGGVRVSGDGVVAPAEVSGDLSDPCALVEQVVHQLVVVTATVRHRAPGLWHLGCGELLVHRSSGGFRQAPLVSGDAAFDGLGEVLPQVEPVGDLPALDFMAGPYQPQKAAAAGNPPQLRRRRERPPTSATS